MCTDQCLLCLMRFKFSVCWGIGGVCLWVHRLHDLDKMTRWRRIFLIREYETMCYLIEDGRMNMIPHIPRAHLN